MESHVEVAEVILLPLIGFCGGVGVMPTYTAKWLDAYYDQKMVQVFEAPDIDIALKLASDKYPNPDCNRIHILNDSFWSNEGKIYENPHYSPSLVNEPSPKGGGKPKSRPEAGRVAEPSDDTQTDLDYFIANDGETKGPYTMSQIRSMWEHGEIPSKAMYATEGDAKWRRVRELVETSGLPLKKATPKIFPKTSEADKTTIARVDDIPTVVTSPPSSEEDYEGQKNRGLSSAAISDEKPSRNFVLIAGVWLLVIGMGYYLWKGKKKDDYQKDKDDLQRKHELMMQPLEDSSYALQQLEQLKVVCRGQLREYGYITDETRELVSKNIFILLSNGQIEESDVQSLANEVLGH